MEPNNRNNRNRGDKNRRRGGGMWSIVLWALLLTIGVNYLSVMLDQARTAESSCEIAYSELVELVEEGKVKSIEFGDTVFTITPVDGFTYTDDDGKSYDQNYTLFTTIIPDATEKLITLCDEHGVAYTKPYQAPISPILAFMVTYILPTVLMVGAFMLLMNFITKKSGGMGGIGGIGNVGKANAKVYMEKSTGVTFADVAGQDEAKESLVEIIDFLHNPEKYTAIGAKIPKGALLVGSPGTGKTLLAKAVAGEAKVPFFSISGSDFVEMFVGVGASRVRDLFQEASKIAPAIIFIDEIDAIGRSRDSRLGNDEREQTLNQLLAEIDGFDSSKGVVILAATNRPEILDKALLRAGRFDRRIIVDRPNLEGRYQTLLVHTRNIRLAEDVDLKKIAQATAGAVGADLANLVNEAALRAVRMGRQTVNQEDLLTSFEVVIAGTEKKGTVLTDIEKRIVAYHEVGHALVAALQKHTQPVSKITIVPHTSGALGYTMQMPEEEKYLNSRDELLVELRTMLGGRAAEQTVFGIETTGASNDIERATDLARKMVMQYGMSDRIGLMALTTKGNEYLDGQSYTDCAQTTAAAADEEVRKLLNDSYDQAKKILTENRGLLDEVALYLLQKETITGDELMQYVDADKRLRGSKQETLPEAEA